MKPIVQCVESEADVEIYLSVSAHGGSLQDQGREVFAAIAQRLRDKSAWICQERIFAPADGVALLAKLRAAAYGDLDDGVTPTWLVGGPENSLRCVQVYAAKLPSRPHVLSVQGKACGRLMCHQGCRWITGSSLPVQSADNKESQTRRAFEEMQALLKSAGADITALARTWCYLDDIVGWYTQFNSARSRFFADIGLLNPASNHGGFPASTGIGVSPAAGASCLVDFFAVHGRDNCPLAPQGCLCKHSAAGRQRSAFEYGSSFARAATVCTPSGRTVFVSGTAAINADGKTCHPDDISSQIRMTMQCIRAVLDDLDCPWNQIVQAVAYCKTAEVEKSFGELASRGTWPWPVIRGDICRDDLLFEAEVTAMKTGRSADVRRKANLEFEFGLLPTRNSVIQI